MARTEKQKPYDASEPAAEVDERLPPIIELTPEEGRAFFDAQARELAGMSGEEFLRRLDAGEFDATLDDPENGHYMYLSMITAFGRG